MTENPSVKISATLTRIAGELDPKTRMMLAEIDLPNKDNAIIPGSYLQVNFQAPPKKFLTIPSEALVVKGGKFFVPMINSSNELHYQPVVVNNNDGVHVSIISGISEGDLIGISVSPELPEGQKVNVQL